VTNMILLKTLLVLFYFMSTASAGTCSDFEEAACELTENNIVGHDRFTNSPGECQAKCVNDAACMWFTHFDTQCYLLSECGNRAHCQGCVSGPENPEFNNCPWPPVPEPSSTTSTTTESTTTSTTTKTTGTSTTPSTPSSTATSSTTTSDAGNCADIKINENCDWNYGLVHWYENVMTGSECQQICKNVNDVRFFSHYNEGREAEHGYCGCFSSCAWPSSEGCYDRCATHEQFSDEELSSEESNKDDMESSEIFGGEVGTDITNAPRPGPRYCHCMRGPLEPDADSCDFWP